jgi:hypothetical protein
MKTFLAENGYTICDICGERLDSATAILKHHIRKHGRKDLADAYEVYDYDRDGNRLNRVR